MKDLRQVILGILAGLLSTALLFGSLSLALVEGNMRQALAPSATLPGSPTLSGSPTPTPPGFTPSPTSTLQPGQPSLTPTRTPTPSITPTPACPYPSDWIRITVLPGDTLESLAEQYHTTAQILKAANGLPTDFLVEGNVLYVPPLPTQTPQPTVTKTPIPCGPYPGWVLYTIRPGDTLYSLAITFNTTVWQLMVANCLPNSNITAGELLWVPNLPTPTYVTPPTSPPTRTPTTVFTATPVPSSTLPVYKPTPTGTETPTPNSTETPTPTNTETATPTDTPSETPTGTPSATATPTDTPTLYINPPLSWLDRLYHPGMYGGR